MEAALTASRAGQHHVLTDFVARYEGKTLSFYKIFNNKRLGDSGAYAVAKGLQENKECKLEKLVISNNSIGAEGERHIAKALEENKSVIKLHMGANSIGPAGAEAIANMLKMNSSLQELYMQDNNIGAEGARAFGEALKVNASLTEISLWGNGIGDAGAIAIGRALEVNSTLTALDIGGNGIGPQGAQSIADTIKKNKTLRELNMDSNNIGPDGAKAFAKALEVNHTLNRLDLDGNAIGDAGAQAIGDVLKVNNSIRSIELGVNDIGVEGAKAIGLALQVNQTLRELNLQYNSITDDGAHAIGEALKVNKTLVKFDVGNNEIGPAGAEAMANMLKVNQTLTTIDLWNNKIGDEGAAHIAAAVKVNKTLVEFDIRWNKIGPAGAAAIANMLKVNQTLRELNLRYNKIGDDGANAIGEALKVNEALQVLSLFNNNIGPEGAKAIADMLKENKTIIELRMGANEIGPAGAEAIANMLKENKECKLEKLDISWNQIGAEGAQHIAKALEINPTLETLDGVKLKDCFKELPAEVLQQGNNGILQYLRSVQSSGTRRSYQGKLVFLGDMGVGKTSLMHTLQGKQYQGTSTVGVDIQEWAVSHPDPAVKEPLTLSTWDFAGQEMYYSAHQLFLSRHSLFMLAWDPSTTEEAQGAVAKLNFWLKSIQARVDAPQTAGESKSTGQGAAEASKPKVFVVATRRDNQRPTPKGYEDEIRKLYSTLELSFYHVSNVGKKEGIEELRRDLTQAAALQKGMGQELARSWLDFRQAVLAKRGSNPYVDSWTLLEQWAKDCKLEAEAIDAVLQYLHMCGSVLYFPEIGRLLITSPQWLSDALRKVITHEQRTDQAQCGLLTEQKRGEAWKEYPESLRRKLGALMEHFELSFRIYEQGPHLLPSMLPLARPRSAELLAPLPSEHQLGVSLVLGVLPPPLLPRFLCRMQKYLPEPSGSHASGLGLKISCWAKGFLMFNDQQRGLVEVGRRNNCSVELQVRGSYPRYFLDEALRTLYCLLQEKFPSIEIQKEEVTCPKCHSPESYVSRENLVRAPSGAEFPCQRCLQSSQVRDWLGYFLAEKYGVEGLGMSTSKETSSRDLGWPLEQLVSEVELRRQQQAKGSTEGEVDRELELAAKACRLMNLVQLNASQNDRSKLFPSKAVLVPVARGKELDFKKGDTFALHLLCEHSKGWHIPKEAEKKTVQRELGPELLQLAPHLQLCLELIKSTGCVVKDAFEAVLKALAPSGAADKAQGTKLAAFTALGDYLARNKELHGLSLCRDSTGDERWLCREHKALLASPAIFKEKPAKIFVSLNPDTGAPEEMERKRAEHKQQLLKEVEKLKKQDGILQRLQEYHARPPRIKYYGFLSHYQKEGADACRAIFEWMAARKLDMWLDKKAERLDVTGMLEGIAESACFVLWGTGGYFDRPFCLFELEMARALKKTIVCIRESDDRMYPLAFQELCRADPQLVLHDVVAVNREYYDAFSEKIAQRLRVGWARCQSAAAAQESGPVSSSVSSSATSSSVKQAAAGGGSGLTQAQLDALHAVELDAESLALTSDEDLEALFKELNVSMSTKIKIKAAKKILTRE